MPLQTLRSAITFPARHLSSTRRASHSNSTLAYPLMNTFRLNTERETRITCSKNTIAKTGSTVSSTTRIALNNTSIRRTISDSTAKSEESVSKGASKTPKATDTTTTTRLQQSRVLTQAQLDEQMARAMFERQGDGGEAGLELEDGRVKGIGRGVKDNMFRYI